MTQIKFLKPWLVTKTRDWKLTRLPLTRSSVLIRYTNTSEQKKIFLKVSFCQFRFKKTRTEQQTTTTDSLFEHLLKTWWLNLKNFAKGIQHHKIPASSWSLKSASLTCNPNGKATFPRHSLCRTSTARAPHNVLVGCFNIQHSTRTILPNSLQPDWLKSVILY